MIKTIYITLLTIALVALIAFNIWYFVTSMQLAYLHFQVHYLSYWYIFLPLIAVALLMFYLLEKD